MIFAVDHPLCDVWNILIGVQDFCWPKFINQLGQKSAFGRFLSCVGIIIIIIIVIIIVIISFLRILWPCSTKIWQMTVLHRNLRNDRAPPKFKKWPCSTEKSQFLIFICSLRFLWIFHASGSIKIGEKLRVWFFQISGPLKFCQICQSTNFYFYPLSKISF